MIDPIELKPASKPSMFKVVRLPAGGRKQIVFRLTDDAGRPVKLVAEPKNEPATEPQFDYQRKLSEGNVKIKLAAKSRYSDYTPLFEVEGKVLESDQCDGVVSFELTEEQASCPGVYLCEVGRFVVPDFLVDTWRVYLCLEPSVFKNMNGAGPITIPEIRLGLGDIEVGDISLLDKLEFEDVEILHCIRQVIDLWNETPPPVSCHTTESFPYRYWWIQGTMALLYRIAAKKYARNQLQYSAGGITIDDQNKLKEYGELASEMMQEFRDWMTREKVRINMELAWSSGI